MKHVSGKQFVEVGSKTVDIGYGKEHVSIPRRLLPDLMQTFSGMVRESRRKAVRVPVKAEKGLICTLEHAGKLHPVTVTDLSLCGAGLVSPLLAGLSVGFHVKLQLTLEEDSVTLFGVVKNRRANVIGVEFPGCLGPGEPEPPDALWSILMSLQI